MSRPAGRGDPRRDIPMESVVVASPDQVSCDLDGEAAILSLRSGIYYGLDEVGSRIWNGLRSPTTVRALLSGLLEEYEVEADRCRDDLLALLRKLEEESLIEIGDG
jgi:hypothetical protein